jgi:hypothetical protein
MGRDNGRARYRHSGAMHPKGVSSTVIKLRPLNKRLSGSGMKIDIEILVSTWCSDRTSGAFVFQGTRRAHV